METGTTGLESLQKTENRQAKYENLMKSKQLLVIGAIIVAFYFGSQAYSWVGRTIANDTEVGRKLGLATGQGEKERVGAMMVGTKLPDGSVVFSGGPGVTLMASPTPTPTPLVPMPPDVRGMPKTTPKPNGLLDPNPDWLPTPRPK
mgnify:CR=1 FL=1